jgi:hypothetical protein
MFIGPDRSGTTPFSAPLAGSSLNLKTVAGWSLSGSARSRQ